MAGARNTPDSFGWVSRAFHWGMAAGILAMLGLGTYIHNMEPALANIWLYGLHKSVGLTLLVLLAMRVLWHRFDPVPDPISDAVPHWQIKASHVVHRLFYLMMVAVPLTGWIASAASGLDVVIFSRFTLPAIAPVSEQWEKLFFVLHAVLTKVLVVLVALHMAGALQRHFIRADHTLRRMTRG